MQTQIGQAAERERGKRKRARGRGSEKLFCISQSQRDSTSHCIASHRIRTAAKLTTVITFSTRHFSFRLLGISHAAKTFPLPLPVITFCHHFFSFLFLFFLSHKLRTCRKQRAVERGRERESRGSHCNLNCQCAQPSRGQRGQHSVGK